MHTVALLVGGVVLYQIFTYAYGLLYNIAEAKRSGLPYIVTRMFLLSLIISHFLLINAHNHSMGPFQQNMASNSQNLDSSSASPSPAAMVARAPRVSP